MSFLGMATGSTMARQRTITGGDDVIVPVTTGIQLYLDAGNTSSYPGTGLTWFDLSPNGNDATYSAATTPYDADGGGCIDFGLSATNDYMNVPDDDTIESGEVWSQAFWIKVTSTTANAYISNKHVNRLAMICGFQDNFVNIFVNGIYPGGGMTIPITADVWAYFCYTKDLNAGSDNLISYKNGAEHTKQTNSFTVDTSAESLRIGSTGSGSQFPGKVAIWQLYDRALTPAEVLQNYNADKARFGL